MREILFRGKRKDNSEWIEGLTLQWNGDVDLQHEEHLFLTPNGYSFPLDIDPETVCQYTGLTDKNGRKIFEGDIVSFDYELNDWGKIAKILFEDGEYRYRAVTNSPGLYNCRICGENDSCKVIGNIFDNPELIGE